MTVLEHDAVSLIDRMAAIWPSRAWTSDHSKEWLAYFTGPTGEPEDGLRFDVADITLEQLKRSKKARPSIAEFQVEARAVYARMPKPEELELVVQDPEAALPPVPPDQGKARARQISDFLRDLPRQPPRRA